MAIDILDENEEGRELAKGVGTHMDEKDYLDLAGFSETRGMSDAEAALFIGRELGFDPLRVKIVREVHDYYKDGGLLRIWHTYRRDPLYCSSDWNYARFDVRGWQYELVNGDLCFYES